MQEGQETGILGEYSPAEAPPLGRGRGGGGGAARG